MRTHRLGRHFPIKEYLCNVYKMSLGNKQPITDKMNYDKLHTVNDVGHEDITSASLLPHLRATYIYKGKRTEHIGSVD